MTLTGLEPKSSHLKSKELTNSTNKNLCSYCNFKVYMVAHNKLIRRYLSRPCIFLHYDGGTKRWHVPQYAQLRSAHAYLCEI